MATTAAPTVPADTHALPRRHGAGLLAALSIAAVAIGLLVPNRTTGSGMDGMAMTHYMGLLAVQQPWNLLLFMALPVVLAETLAITELILLFRRRATPLVAGLSRWAGLLAGPVMLGITVHLLVHAVVPLTTGGGWRGPADVIAVLAYLLGVVPLMGISLVEAGILGHDDRHALKLHVTFVAVFLVVAHIAMIAGMLDPTVLGWQDPSGTAPMDHGTHQMPDGTTMTNQPGTTGTTPAPAPAHHH